MRNYIYYVEQHDGQLNRYTITAYTLDHAISMAIVCHPHGRIVDCFDERMSVVSVH